jgi:hypothetical protein
MNLLHRMLTIKKVLKNRSLCHTIYSTRGFFNGNFVGTTRGESQLTVIFEIAVIYYYV